MNLDPHAAIDGLYSAFARPLTNAVDGCPCCITPAELAVLNTTPLRALSADALESYASSVMLTVGDADDLRYFWPRLVELSYRGELFTDREIVFSKPRRAEWRTWPEAEQRANEAFVDAVFVDMAARPYEGSEVNEWVCAFSLMLGDVTPYLTPLLVGTPAAAASLYGFHAWNARKLARGRLGNAFWRDEPRGLAAMIAWFRRPEVEAAITAAYALQFAGPDATA